MKLSRSSLEVRAGVFAELQAQIDAVAARGGDLIPLQIGDTCRSPPAISPVNARDLHPYGATAGLAELRAALASHMMSHAIGPEKIDPGAEIALGVGPRTRFFAAQKRSSTQATTFSSRRRIGRSRTGSSPRAERVSSRFR